MWLVASVTSPVFCATLLHASRRKMRCSGGSFAESDFDSANFSSIATDAKGVIQIFNVGAERMLGTRPPT